MDYKVEGNIIFPNEHMLTWGPFYYHSEEKAKDRMESVLNDIVSWCNLQDPSLQIKPEKLIKHIWRNVVALYLLTQYFLKINLWKHQIRFI